MRYINLHFTYLLTYRFPVPNCLLPLTVYCYSTNKHDDNDNKNSAVAQMGDRLTTYIDMGRKVRGLLYPFFGGGESWVSI